MRTYDSTKIKMGRGLHPAQKEEIMAYFKKAAMDHEKKQIKETFEVALSFTAEDIVKARAWEHDHHYNYDDIRPLLLDAFNAGVINCPRAQIH